MTSNDTGTGPEATQNISITDQDVTVTCPRCGEEHERIWYHGNGLDLIHDIACPCGNNMTLIFQIGATLECDDWEGYKEGWL